MEKSNIEQKRARRTDGIDYKSASLIVYGAVCAVLMVNNIAGWRLNYFGRSELPGFWAMSGLCCPILYCWLGLLLRYWKPNPKWWMQLIVAGISIYGVCDYLVFDGDWRHFWTLFFGMAGIGYLIPPEALKKSTRNRGWISLVMVAISVFCYTAINISMRRLLARVGLMPGHEDMRALIETLLVIAEPMMLIITAYFVVQFSFSRIARNLGSRSWFVGTVAVPCVYVFIFSSLRVLRHSGAILGGLRYDPLPLFIVQPVTIYLAISLIRVLKRKIACLQRRFRRRKVTSFEG